MEKIVEPGVYLRTCAALLALLALTWAIGYVDLGQFNLILALAIAITKAILIALFFMHLIANPNLTRVIAIGAIVWLLILMSLTLGDYFTRGWVPVPGR